MQAAAFYASYRQLVSSAVVAYTAPPPPDECHAWSGWLIAVVALSFGMLIASILNWLHTPWKPRTPARLMQTDFDEQVYFATTTPGCLHVRRNCAAPENCAIQERCV